MIFNLLLQLTATSSARAFADQSVQTDQILNFGRNAIKDCRVVPGNDGPHILILIRGAQKGDSIHFEDDQTNTYDYIFGYASESDSEVRTI